jgi:deoxycytidylate deaminase
VIDHIRDRLVERHRAEVPWCLKGAVTAVLFDPTAPAPGGWRLFGHNGPLDVCIGCDLAQRCRKSVHAEMRVLMAAASLGVAPAGLHLMVTTAPCYRCAQLLVLARVTTVYFLESYRECDGLEILQARGVKVYRFDGSRPVAV